MLLAGRQLLWNGASVDMQEGKDTADSFVPFQTLWLTAFYGTRITGDIGYYSYVNIPVTMGPPPYSYHDPTAHLPRSTTTMVANH
jgi:hypothetical protein